MGRSQWLDHFLENGTENWREDESIRTFELQDQEYLSCIRWRGESYMTGTDILRVIVHRIKAFGRNIVIGKKFEEGIFSDLRTLKPGQDSLLEQPRSPFLQFLFENGCVRTQKKQKVFRWGSIPHDKLFIDALERDFKREEEGRSHSTTVAVEEPAISFVYTSGKSLSEHVFQAIHDHEKAQGIKPEEGPVIRSLLAQNAGDGMEITEPSQRKCKTRQRRPGPSKASTSTTPRISRLSHKKSSSRLKLRPGTLKSRHTRRPLTRLSEGRSLNHFKGKAKSSPVYDSDESGKELVYVPPSRLSVTSDVDQDSDLESRSSGSSAILIERKSVRACKKIHSDEDLEEQVPIKQESIDGDLSDYEDHFKQESVSEEMSDYDEQSYAPTPGYSRSPSPSPRDHLVVRRTPGHLIHSPTGRIFIYNERGSIDQAMTFGVEGKSSTLNKEVPARAVEDEARDLFESWPQTDDGLTATDASINGDSVSQLSFLSQSELDVFSPTSSFFSESIYDSGDEMDPSPTRPSTATSNRWLFPSPDTKKRCASPLTSLTTSIVSTSSSPASSVLARSPLLRPNDDCPIFLN